MIIEINHVTKTVKGNDLLKDIDLRITKPGVYGVIGRNGSGKSVLFKTIAGLLRPTTGEVKVFGEKVGNGRFPKHFGALFDLPGFVPRYTAFNNLKLLASIRGIISTEDIRQVISKVGLDPDDRRPVKKYSYGMRQRLGIAQAIMENPSLLILDEPMNGLDETGVEEIRGMILEFKKQGMTVLIASHNSEDIKLLCDQVYRMDQGKLTLHQTETVS
ncbi:ATP-binding cassette domain-containing protein [Bhargavaea beijingensis]|nr:ABC transporter ATP-binding protein [Bhargavaea beijingensis]MCW1927437.1 ABC transporter ATP-binding protein [Bhargavaea beijingensis]RSK30077.1 ABC transporter ATP-binding protein [Bhargavaea beijingensis]